MLGLQGYDNGSLYRRGIMIAVIDKNVRESCLIISQRAAFSPCWRKVVFYDEQFGNIETK